MVAAGRIARFTPSLLKASSLLLSCPVSSEPALKNQGLALTRHRLHGAPLCVQSGLSSVGLATVAELLPDRTIIQFWYIFNKYSRSKLFFALQLFIMGRHKQKS